MKKIKISAIVLITCLFATFIFNALIPMWLGISLGFLSAIMLVLLNVEILKIKGMIKKLVLCVDITVGLFLVLTFISKEFINYTVNDYLSHFLVLIFAGLLIAILVNAHRIERKD